MRLIGAFVGLAMAVMPSFGAVAQASTSNPILYNQSGKTVSVKYCFDRTTGKPCGELTTLKNGKNIKMICYADAYKYAYTGNYSSRRWFYIEFKYDIFNWRTAYGWVHSSYVYYQTSVPHC